MKRSRTVVASLVALALPAGLAVPFVLSATVGEQGVYAAGPDSGAPATGSNRPLDPNNVTNISPYMKKLLEGNAKFLVGDKAGAAATYRDAIPLQGSPPFKNALGHYLLGEALAADGKDKEAEDIWRQGDAIAASTNPVVRAPILFALANLKERQKAWGEARAAWALYTEWAQKVPVGDAGPQAFPASGTERVRAIDQAMKLDKDYEVVRQRIREQAGPDGGVFNTLDAAK